MLFINRKPLRGVKRKRNGTATVELAVCLPLIVIIAFGSIEATNMIFLEQRLTAAAYEGAQGHHARKYQRGCHYCDKQHPFSVLHIGKHGHNHANRYRDYARGYSSYSLRECADNFQHGRHNAVLYDND